MIRFKLSECTGFAAVPVPQAETWKTVCNAPGRLDIPSPLLAAANPHGLPERHSDYTNVGRDTFQHMVLICRKLTEGAWTMTSDGAGGRTQPRWRHLQRGTEMTILRKELGDPLRFYCRHTWQTESETFQQVKPSTCKSSFNNSSNNTIQDKHCCPEIWRTDFSGNTHN